MGARAVIAAALLFASGACGVPSGPEVTLYTVTATVMQKPGEPPHACFGTPLPYPPIGCGGPDVHASGAGTLPWVTTYRNGVRATSMLRLVGSWGGGALTLSEPPVPVDARSAQNRVPECKQDGSEPQGPGLPPMMQKVVDDDALLKAKGIQVLEMYMCKKSLFMLVPVADPSTVSFLTQRYAPIIVAGWLQRVR